MQRAKPFIIVGLILLALYGLLRLIPDGGLGQPGSTLSTMPDGLSALELWLQSLDYKTRRFEFEEWVFDENTDAIISVAPRSFTGEEADEALFWVRETGGTLIVVAEEDNALFRELDVEVIDLDAASLPVSTTNPLAHPPVGQIGGGYPRALSTTRTDGATVLESAGDSYLMAFAEGAGLVYLSTRVDVWSNRGLREPDNAKVVLNTLSRVPPGGTILFDEVHHGRALPPPRPRNPVVFSPLVSSLVYMALVIGLWAFLAGRRFGAPVPLRIDVARRTSAEYVQSMANLFERGRQTGYILNYYKTAFKRRVARPFGFNPRIADDRFVSELRRYATFDEQRLAQLLEAMSAQRPAEGTLLRLVHESDAFAASLERQQ